MYNLHRATSFHVSFLTVFFFFSFLLLWKTVIFLDLNYLTVVFLRLLLCHRVSSFYSSVILKVKLLILMILPSTFNVFSRKPILQKAKKSRREAAECLSSDFSKICDCGRVYLALFIASKTQFLYLPTRQNLPDNSPLFFSDAHLFLSFPVNLSACPLLTKTVSNFSRPCVGSSSAALLVLSVLSIPLL